MTCFSVSKVIRGGFDFLRLGYLGTGLPGKSYTYPFFADQFQQVPIFGRILLFILDRLKAKFAKTITPATNKSNSKLNFRQIKTSTITKHAPMALLKYWERLVSI
jgi:hypothetical protein